MNRKLIKKIHRYNTNYRFVINLVYQYKFKKVKSENDSNKELLELQ